MNKGKERCLPCEAPGISGFGFRIGISLALSGQAMVFGLGYNNALASGEAPSPESTLYWVLHGSLILSSIVVIGLLGGPLLKESVKALRDLRFSVEALFVLSTVGALGGSLISTITGEGSVYYEVVSLVLCVYAIGKQVGAVQKGQLGAAVSSFRNAFDVATIQMPDGQRERLPVSRLNNSHVVLVSPGDPIPIDAVISEGSGYIRETSLTGEPAPVSKKAGDEVLAGTWSVDGNLKLVPKLGQPRTIDQILELLEAAPAAPSKLQKTADRLMQVFVPVVSLTSLATFLGWFFVSCEPWWDALFNSMAVLLVACPCALGLAMPAGIWAGLFYMSQRGVVGRHGHLLDTLAECQTVIFDKTGTLSHFDLKADTSQLGHGDMERFRVIDEVASLGAASHHPVSQALAELSEMRLAVSAVQVYPGAGIGGNVGGDSLVIGELGLLEEKGIRLPDELPSGHGKPVHVARSGVYAGALFLNEVLREEAGATLQALRELGCRCMILSGDPGSEHAAIGDVPVEGGLSPEAKAERVLMATEEGGEVLFVGDGVNDVLAMQASHSALAIDLGAALATEFADGLLVEGQISALPGAIRHARKLKAALQGNLLFALCYNLIGMGLAAGGVLHPVVAALLMVGSSAVVSFRALSVASRVS
ncbi:cation-translocating P-type ATPase [Puniceicoccales bacterium CK1056]|uniref:Cation-translocating P-type ATPase n=1 Tax=Oceanipulchritudo coccoides TaxID=2706888 RepID=A0A6B2LXC6_9BACT|nr:heavy metal translocating P-type ATPase [Oceanipulchritudo coccoides]NDV60883.1 cation-translocating P-type ATPase [Oceanipulchritudo coccoides]